MMRLLNTCGIWEIKEDKAVRKSACVGREPCWENTTQLSDKLQWFYYNVILNVEEGYKSK